MGNMGWEHWELMQIKVGFWFLGFVSGGCSQEDSFGP